MPEQKLATHRMSSNLSAEYWVGEEEVNGVVIGSMTDHFVFMRTCTIPGVLTWQEPVCRGEFENDAEAIAWFKENYPADFAQGCEMRVYA